MNIKTVKSGAWMATSGIGLWLWVWYMFDRIPENAVLLPLAMMFAMYGGLILVGAGMLRSIIGLLQRNAMQRNS